jgi:hypothetical protein
LPLLERLAHDPIFLVHRECDNAGGEIRDAELLAGRTPPVWTIPPRSPRGEPARAFEFVDRTPEPVGLPGTISLDVNDPDVVLKALQSVVDAAQYKNVGNGFARNAERMRLIDSAEIARVLDPNVARKPPKTPEFDAALSAALDSPYPFAHYVATRLITLRGETLFAPKIAGKLPDWIAAADTVGVYWGADALGRIGSAASGDVLTRIAVEKSYDRTFGPIGMAYGFAAARGLGMLAQDLSDGAVARALASENVWLRAGVLDGLVERGRVDIGPALEKLAIDSPNAILMEEARFGLKTIQSRDRRRAANEP